MEHTIDELTKAFEEFNAQLKNFLDQLTKDLFEIISVRQKDHMKSSPKHYGMRLMCKNIHKEKRRYTYYNDRKPLKYLPYQRRDY